MDYAYLSGVLKYRENVMLNANDIERMADASNASSAFQVFNDTDYSDNILDVETENYQKALDDDLKQVKDLFINHLDSNLLKFLFLRYDAHNIKLLLKAKYLKKNLDQYLSHLGIEDLKKIKKYICCKNTVNNVSQLDEDIKNIINKAEEFIGGRPFPHRIDYIVDREYFHILHNIAKKLKNNYIKKLVCLQIDIANLKILLRAKTSEKPYEFVEKKFIKYGGIKIEKSSKDKNDGLKNLYTKEADKIIEFYKNYFKNKELNYIFDNFKKDANLFWKIEKALENIELAYIKKSKYISYGPEVVIGYYYAKKNAGRNVRLIMTGKINNVPVDEIKERLSMGY